MSTLVWTPPQGPATRPEYPGWQSAKYVPLPIIEYYAEETLRLFAQRCGGSVTFPVDAERLAREVLGLDIYYDDGTIMDEMESGLLGCLFADGMPCPATGRDRVIMVNDGPRYRGVTAAFTILHEGGHWLLHVPQDAVAEEPLSYCRAEELLPSWSKVPPREWQASRLAAEVLMPREMVCRILDGREPEGEVINLEIYGRIFREFFGVSQEAMEKRLSDLKYRYAFGRYPYANLAKATSS